MLCVPYPGGEFNVRKRLGTGTIPAAVNLVQAVDAYLDGDGTIETLVVAGKTELANQMSDVYSLLFAVSPAWDEAAVVAESVIPADDTGFN